METDGEDRDSCFLRTLSQLIQSILRPKLRVEVIIGPNSEFHTIVSQSPGLWEHLVPICLKNIFEHPDLESAHFPLPYINLVSRETHLSRIRKVRKASGLVKVTWNGLCILTKQR